MSFLLKATLSVAILYFAFRNIDFAAVVQQFDQLNPGALGMALALMTLSILLAAARWRIVTRYTEGASPGYQFFVRSLYRCVFINQGLPSTLGGDAMRVLDLSGPLGSKREAFGTVLLDRVIGLSGLLILNVLMFPVSAQLLPFPIALSVTLISAAGLLAIAGAIAFPWQRVSHHHPLLDMIADFSEFARRVLAHPQGFLLQCLLSMSVHLSAIVAMYVLARQFGVTADLLAHVAIQPSVFIAALLPLSLAGWGVREGAMAALFATIGVAAPAILATSLCYGVIALVASFPGLYFLLKFRSSSSSQNLNIS